jgi:hypothetical protein
MDPAEEWCTISRAVEIIVSELHTSTGRAETRLIEACAAGNVRSRVKRVTAADRKSSIEGHNAALESMVYNFFRRAGPLSPLIWKGAAIDGDALCDRSRSRWSPVEINVADLRFDLASAGPVAPATVRVISEKGGRPTDKLRVVEEAQRRLKGGESIPSTLAEFARELHEWLERQPNAIRASKTREVMSDGTIEDHVRPVWNEHRKKH